MKAKDLLLGGLGGIAAPVIANLPKLGLSLNPNKATLDELEIEEKKKKQAALAANPAGVSAMKKGGAVKKYAKGGSASKRADGCAVKGKTRGKMV